LENYEVVYDIICRLGGARLDRLVAQCKLSQSTASRAIKELDADYMIWREKNIWYPTSAVARKVSQPAKSGEVSQDRSALRRDNGKTASRDGLPEGIPTAFRLEESEDAAPAPLRGPAGCQVVVDQDADVPDVMKHIVDELVSARIHHNRLEGIRTIRARISKRKRRKKLLDTEVTQDLYVLARLLWVAMKTSTWDTDANFRAWLTADMNRLVPGWRDKVNQAVVEIAEAA
jgi:hypothetical protein